MPLKISKKAEKPTNVKPESVLAGQKRSKAVSEKEDVEQESVQAKKSFGNITIETPKFKRVNKAKLKEF